MKLSKLSRTILVSSAGLVLATLLTSCEIVTIDYLFVANSAGTGSSGSGEIQTFDVDSESGAFRTGAKPVSSGGNNPVAIAVTADYNNLYVVNQASNNVVHFSIADTGALTQKDMVTTGPSPTFIAVNTAGTYLYIVSGPNPAMLTAYSLSGGTIGSVAAQETLSVPGYTGDTLAPTAVTVLANNDSVYVTAYDQSAYNPSCVSTPTSPCTTSLANPGWIFGYAVGTGGALTPASGSPWKAGVKPVALAADPTNRFVYVTDFASNQMIGYTIQSGSVLNFLLNGPFSAGSEPTAIIVDPRGKYIYVSNGLSNTVTAFTISLATGTPTATINTTGSQTNSTDTDPISVTVDAALGRFVYTANYLGNSISGFRLNPDTGALSPTVAGPYPSGSKPAVVATVPHGNHAIQSVTP
jgi:6-phosphogluconolactonase (cycloisomerase 2 family)